MVTVNFRLSDIGSLKLKTDGPVSLKEILDRCALETNIEIGPVIVSKNGRVVSQKQMIEKGDCIDVFPAISGG